MSQPAGSIAARLWTYQAERFPLVKHGVLIGAFGASAVCLSALLRGGVPAWHSILVAVVVLMVLFLQLRVADEHKDAEDDARFRPERPVPRGLVSLGELRWLAVAAGLGAIVLAAGLDWRLFAPLLAAWAWMGLMAREFFVAQWLKARPILYMVSHMLVMPLIDLFATACDWLPAGGFAGAHFGEALAAFLALSFFNGAALEIARKSWAPENEREGVETYSRLWGARTAGLAAGAMMFAGFCLAAFVHVSTQAHWGFLVLLGAAALYGLFAAVDYAGTATPKTAKGLETAAGVFVLVNYLALGVLPMLAVVMGVA